MPVAASAIGTQFGERSVEVTAQMMLAYAAAVGETGELTFDDARESGFQAPASFCTALEWRTARDQGISEQLGITAAERLQTLHIGQDSLFHRPIVAGQRLRISGVLTDVGTMPSGARMTCLLRTIDESDGEPVVSSWITALVRGALVVGDHCPVAEPPVVPAGPPAHPESVEIPVARGLPHVYAECSGIRNPIHTERRVALAAGLPDIILHGTATWALAGRELTRRYARGNPSRLRRLAGRFAAVVIPGTTIVMEHAALGGDANRVSFRIRNHRGEEAITGGYAEFDTDGSANAPRGNRS